MVISENEHEVLSALVRLFRGQIGEGLSEEQYRELARISGLSLEVFTATLSKLIATMVVV